MHFSNAIAAAVLATTTTVLALPSSTSPYSPLVARAFTPQPDDPSMTPVDVRNLASDATMTCGGTTFKYDDIYKAAQWGDLLQDNNLRRGKKSNQFPNGRFPHSYTDTQYSFNDDCPADDNRQEFPLIVDGPYNGGPNNNKWGNHRVVYYREEGEVAEDMNPIVYFCGGLTHEGAPTGKFLQCTVN